MTANAVLAQHPSHAVIADGVRRLGLVLSEDTQRRLLLFVALLHKWNGTYNLTAVREPGDMLTVHLLDSLSILPLLDSLAPTAILDVGSGAGLPAIPIAICRPKWMVRAVDAVAKKISFQRQVRTELVLANLTPVHARVEALTLAERPDVIVSRAYASIPQMLESIDHLVGPETVVVAMKGALPVDELRALPRAWAVTETRALDVPFLGAQRCAVVLRRR